MRIVKAICLWLCLINSSYALQSEHLLWEKLPLSIELPIKQERLIQFPQAIKIIQQQLSPNLSILKVKGSLYLKAKSSFEYARLIVQLLPAGDVVILNIKADDKFNNTTPIEILTDDASHNSVTATSHYEYNAIQLTRFAIQSLYSPERLLSIPPGVYRTAMQTHKTINLFYGASVKAHPIASWRGGSLHVTAVEVTNLLNKAIKLNPDNLVGHWQSVSFYPSNHLPARTKHISTTVFIISDKPFHQALSDNERYSR